jgi:hypothetical protein
MHVRVRLFVISVLLLNGPLSAVAQAAGGTASPSDLQFTSGRSARAIPFDLVGNHIYVQARVNGHGPFWFLFDTGATASYFSVEHADSLAPASDNVSLKGVSLDLSGVKLTGQSFSLVPVRFGIYDGHPVHGLLGYDFIRRFVVVIDYAGHTMTLHEPGKYVYSGRGHIVQLVMLEDDSGGKVPLVRAAVTQEGRAEVEGNFIVDTGVRSAITFNSPFEKLNSLLQFARNTVRVSLGGGAMVRESRQPAGRLKAVRLGRYTVKNPVAIFFQDTTGIVASPEFDGVIGGEVLRRFKVIFDYPRERMILEPNRNFSEREEYDMSGTLLTAEGPDFRTFRVRQIIDGSPASAAGLRDGDIISAIGGNPASTLTLEQVRRIFRQNGRTYRLKIRRGERDVEATIRLRRLM